MEDSIRDVSKATQEIKVMQDMFRAILLGELEDVKAGIEAKIAAAKRDITLSKPLPAQLSACIAALKRAAAKCSKAEEVLEKASRDAEFASEEVTRLVSEKSRVEQSFLSTQSARSCLQSLSSSFHHVLSDMQSSLGVDENIVAQATVDVGTLFSKLNGLVAAVASASASSSSQSASSRCNARSKASKRCAPAPPSPAKDDHPTGGHRF